MDFPTFFAISRNFLDGLQDELTNSQRRNTRLELVFALNKESKRSKVESIIAT